VAWQPIALALGAGFLGGSLFNAAHVPLGWLLGAMTATLVLALCGRRVSLPIGLRRTTMAVLGVFLGSTFSADTLARAGEWPLSLGAMLLFVPTATVLISRYFQRVGGFDPITAFYAATPGGLTPMVLIGQAAGGDERRIALVHAFRVLLLVWLIPWIVVGGRQSEMALGAGGGIGAGAGAGTGTGPDAVSGVGSGIGSGIGSWVGDIQALLAPPEVLAGFAILAAAAVVAYALAQRCRLPAAEMTGPMFASAGLHLSGMVAVSLPPWLIAITLVVVGAGIGCRFSGFAVAESLRTIGVAAGSTLAMIAAAAAVAAVLAGTADFSFWSVLLALAPGGVSEMCLIAVAVNLDPAFVAFHHLARLMLVLVAAPIVGRLVVHRRTRPQPEPAAGARTET